MICRRCLRAAAAAASRSHPPAPTLSAAAAAAPWSSSPSPFATSYLLSRRPLTITATAASPPTKPAAATDSSATGAAGKQPRASPANAPIAVSSVPAGTPLRGLNFIKGQSDPVAMEDHEYPAWLWEVLKTEEVKGDDGAEGDLFAKSKKQRRIAAKKLRKQQLLHPEMLEPKVPIYEQSIDLPAGDGSVQGSMDAGKARQELTKAMRAKRRSQIKEDNFLREMR